MVVPNDKNQTRSQPPAAALRLEPFAVYLKHLKGKRGGG